MFEVWTEVRAGRLRKSLEKWIGKDSFYRGGLSTVVFNPPFLTCLAVWSRE